MKRNGFTAIEALVVTSVVLVVIIILYVGFTNPQGFCYLYRFSSLSDVPVYCLKDFIK